MKTNRRQNLFSYPILYPLCHIHQRKLIKTKLTQITNLLQCSMSSAYFWGKRLLQNADIWFIKSRIQRWNVLSNHALLEQKKLARHWDRTCWVDNEKSNVLESPIACDTLLITDAEFGVNGDCQNSYLNVPCKICTMRSLLYQMMEVYLEPYTPIQMMW